MSLSTSLEVPVNMATTFRPTVEFDFFFNQIRGWCQAHVQISEPEIQGINVVKLGKFLGHPHNMNAILTNSVLVQDLVVSFVTLHVTFHCLMDEFLKYSKGLHGGHYAKVLNEEYERLSMVPGPSSPCRHNYDIIMLRTDALQRNNMPYFYGVERDHPSCRHCVLRLQQRLYVEVQKHPDHAIVRPKAAENVASFIITEVLTTFQVPVSGGLTAAHAMLTQLVMDGFRIGYQMRTQPLKWRIDWPDTLCPYVHGEMATVTRDLYGTPTLTFEVLAQRPELHYVRLGLTPTISKVDVSSGYEQREVVHRAMVHLARRF